MSQSRCKKNEQLELNLPTWGGKRAGAGRKRVGPRAKVAHVLRPKVSRWNPVFITIRLRDDVPDVRQPSAWKEIILVLRAFRSYAGLRIVHYSIVGNHAHFIAECEGREALSLGMRRLCAALARALNRCFARSGPVLAGRYHARELMTPTEVNKTLLYVLLNGKKHAAESGVVLPSGWVDPRSTAAIFDGWRDPPPLPERTDYGTSEPRTWLLKTGWRTCGLLALDEMPSSTRARDCDAIVYDITQRISVARVDEDLRAAA
jgi:hypothetical protein